MVESESEDEEDMDVNADASDMVGMKYSNTGLRC